MTGMTVVARPSLPVVSGSDHHAISRKFADAGKFKLEVLFAPEE